MTTCPECGHVAPTPTGRHWTFTLPLSVPSQNEVSNAGRWGHGQKRYRNVRDDAALLLASEMRRLAIPAANERRGITFTRLYGKGKRAYDYGNLVGGMKAVLDSAVRVGLLVDDCPKWCDDHYLQERAEDGRDAVMVRIEEML